MPALAMFMIRHFSNGFLLGAGAAVAVALAWPDSTAARLASESLPSLALFLYATGASFGMGSLATALWLDVGRG